MKKTLMIFALCSVLALTGCATIGGTVAGAGIGYMLGDAELGAAVGMTSGAVVDIFGR